MEILNNWLRDIQASGRGTELYNATGTVCIILLVVFMVFYIWRQKLNPLKAIPITAIAYYFLIYAQYLVTWYRRGFDWGAYFGTANIGYAFTLLPLLCWLCDITFNIPKGTSGELAAVTTLGWHFVGRSGCTFSGCCHGIDCTWGVYSIYAEGNTFPVCWVESLLSLGILIFLLVRMFRRGRVPDNGQALPLMLLLYGGGRFFTEFLRYHPAEDILFGFLPEFSVHALLMAAVGAVLLYCNIRKAKAVAAAAAESSLPEMGGRRR